MRNCDSEEDEACDLFRTDVNEIEELFPRQSNNPPQVALQSTVRGLRVEFTTASCGAKETAEESNSPSSEHPLFVALRDGRVLEAQRLLSTLGDSNSDNFPAVSSQVREQIRRISSRFKDSEHELQFSEGNGWITDRGSSAAVRLSNGEFQLVFTITIKDCSPLLAFAALCELDLSTGYNPDLVTAEVLSEEMPADSIWRVTKQSKWNGNIEDNIRYISAIDALDEPESSLWVSMYAPSEPNMKLGGKDVGGFVVPDPSPGTVRNWCSRSTFRIQPVVAEGRSNCFKLTMAILTKTSAKSCSALSLSPTWVVKKLIRGEVDSFSDLLQKYLVDCSDLKWRIQHSKRASLYQQVWMRLAAKGLDRSGS